MAAIDFKKPSFDGFTWDQDKAEVNFRKHDIAFAIANFVFDDPRVVDEIDEDHVDDDRFCAIGLVRGKLLHVTYTVRDGMCRIISAREASKHEWKRYLRQEIR